MNRTWNVIRKRLASEAAKKHARSAVALLLAAVMCLALMPVNAYAADTQDGSVASDDGGLFTVGVPADTDDAADGTEDMFATYPLYGKVRLVKWDYESSAYVPIDNVYDLEFTFVLSDSDGNPAANKSYTTENIQGYTDSNGQFSLKAGETACFRNIAKDGTVWTVTQESLEYDLRQVFPENGGGSRVTISKGDDNITEFWNAIPELTTEPECLVVHNLFVRKTLVKQVDVDDTAQLFNISDGAYGFKLVNGKYVSNNLGKANSTARSTWTALYDTNLSFFYSYSSEENRDKFTLTIAGDTIENAVSGATTTKLWVGRLKAGESVEMTYAKDGSGDSYDDQCVIYDIIATAYEPIDPDDTEFTFKLSDPDGNPAAGILYVTDDDYRGGAEGRFEPGNGIERTDDNGQFKLKAGEIATFDVTDEAKNNTGWTIWSVSEIPTTDYEQVMPASGGAARVTASSNNTLKQDNVAEFCNRANGGGGQEGCPPDDLGVGDLATFNIDMCVSGPYIDKIRAFDKLSDGLTFRPDSLSVKIYQNNSEIGRDVLPTDYTLAEDDENYTFKLELDGPLPAQKYNFEGGRINISYDAMINANALVGDIYDPCKTVAYWNDPNEYVSHFVAEMYPVHEFSIIKHDSNNPSVKLAGAKFELRRMVNTSEYVPVDLVDITSESSGFGKVYRIWTDDYPENRKTTKIVTDGTGQAAIQGLDAGFYSITETDAPDGYVSLSKPIGIEVRIIFNGGSHIFDEYGNGISEGSGIFVNAEKLSGGKIYIPNRIDDDSYRGTTPAYAIGGMLALAGCAALTGVRKRKETDRDE